MTNVVLSQRPTLLSLPFEIRTIIYCFALEDGEIEIDPFLNYTRPRNRRKRLAIIKPYEDRPPLPTNKRLQYVCRQIDVEVGRLPAISSAMYYFPHSTELHGSYLTISPMLLTGIRHLRLDGELLSLFQEDYIIRDGGFVRGLNFESKPLFHFLQLDALVIEDHPQLWEACRPGTHKDPILDLLQLHVWRELRIISTVGTSLSQQICLKLHDIVMAEENKARQFSGEYFSLSLLLKRTDGVHQDQDEFGLIRLRPGPEYVLPEQMIGERRVVLRAFKRSHTYLGARGAIATHVKYLRASVTYPQGPK